MKLLITYIACFIFTFLANATEFDVAAYYQDAEGKQQYELKTALHKLIRGHTRVTYTPGIWQAYQHTDLRTDGTVWCIYTTCPFNYGVHPDFLEGYQCGSTGMGFTECFCYSREHSFPKSFWGGGTAVSDTAYTDVFHIYPASGRVNSVLRNDNVYANVGTLIPKINDDNPTSNGSKLGYSSVVGYDGQAFEIADEYKGDIARTYFYIATRYQHLIPLWHATSTGTKLNNARFILEPNTNAVFQNWYLNMLLTWHRQDPVSAKEISRNNAIFTHVQNNRNPFIDYPDLVEYIWGNKQTEKWRQATSFSSVKEKSFSMYPSPDEHFFYCDLKSEGEIGYVIQDVSGRIIRRGSFFPPYQFFVSDLHKGIYIMHLKENGKVSKNTFFVK
jgi:endonuclease I